MATMSAPSHSVIQGYLTDRLSGDERRQFSDRAGRDETARSLQVLLDRLSARYDFRRIPDRADDPLPPSAMTACLQDIWAGRFEHPQLDGFAWQLYHSAGFYDRLYRKLEEMSSLLAPAASGELEGIPFPSRDAVFARAGIRPRRKTVITRLAEWSRHHPGGLAAAAVLLLLLLAGPPAWIALNRDGDTSLQYYVTADDRLPYPLPDMPFLRSLENQSGRSIAFRKLMFGYRNGLNSYNGRDFPQAIQHFRQTAPEAEDLLSRPEIDSLTLRILRDRYFYLGLSLLKVSRDPDLAAPDREQYLQEAVPALKQALRLSLEHRLSQSDRDRYFLAIAHEFAGDITTARTELEAIPPESRFYPDSRILRREWGKR